MNEPESNPLGYGALVEAYWGAFGRAARSLGWGVPAILGRGEIDLLMDTARDPSLPAGGILEIGTAWGATTIALALANADRGGDEIVLTCDPFPYGDFGEASRLLDALARIRGSAHYLCGTSETIRRLVDRRAFRLIFIDGDHRETSVRRDLENCGRLVARDGVVIMHDVSDRHTGVLTVWDGVVTSGGLRCGDALLRPVKVVHTCGILRAE